MNILYYGFKGSANVPVLGWILIAVGAGFVIVSAICWLNDAINGAEFAGGCFASVFAILLGVVALADTRVPIVKATVNNEIPWVEVAKDYKYLGNEGNIYIFEALNKTIEEWEPKVNGMEN